MTTINCIYSPETLSYKLFFSSKNQSFDTEFKIICPDNFTYKQVSCYDGFVFAIIFAAMECGEDLYTDLPLSTKGVQNMHYFIEAWHNLMPKKLKKIKVFTKNIRNDLHPMSEESISAFSGGVDSCFTLLRHNEKDWGEGSFNIKNVLSVHGFDIRPEKQDEYNELIDRISPISEQFNCNLFKVWTDLKFKSKQDWEMSHAAQLASCFHLFSEHFNNALMGSTEPYSTFFVPWGSTPATDYLLSSDMMTLQHDGAGYSRTNKVERIATNEIITNYVKVCWENGVADNCGECEKCFRTRLNFIAAGNDSPKCFNGKINFSKFRKVRFTTNTSIVELKSILLYAQQHNLHGQWISEIKWKIFTSKILNIKPFLFMRRVKLKLIKEFKKIKNKK